jgi:outer membrane lipoprotein carrier protein
MIAIPNNEVMMRAVRWLFFFLPMLVLAQINVPISMSATFVQKITTPHKKTTRYTGSLLLNRSREFRWAYRSPTRREICGDSSRVRIVDHDLEQVTIYRVGSLLDLMQLLKRAEPYRGDLYLAKYHGTRYTLKINKKGQVEQIAFKDDMDNVVNIHFHKIHYRTAPFGSAKLRCVIPKKYDVIRG